MKRTKLQRSPLSLRNITKAGVKQKMRAMGGGYHARPENRIHSSEFLEYIIKNEELLSKFLLDRYGKVLAY